MNIVRNFLVTAGFVLAVSAAQSETAMIENGSDTFIAGPTLDETLNSGGDTFLAGRSTVARGVSQGDLHITGFDVTVRGDTLGDLYVLGANVTLRGTVAEDTTAAGFTLRTEDSALTSGNARLIGNTLTIEGPVTGALSVTGRDVILNAPVSGDARILAQTLSFGPNAQIGGTLTYSTQDQLAVPERVAPPARVVFEPLSDVDAWNEWDEWDGLRHELPVMPTIGSMLMGFVISLLFFVVLGALMLGFMPKRLEAMRQTIRETPGRTFLLGVIGLSMLFGMVPITALTIVGLPFVPIAVLLIVLAWTLGYALGAYSVAMWIWVAFGGDPTPGNITRLLVLAAAIIIVALLNFIPFVGWVINYTLVLLGIGAMTYALFMRLIGSPSRALDVDMKPIND